MFRIDKAFVAYERTEHVYTNVDLESQKDLQVKKLRPVQTEEERQKERQRFLDQAKAEAEVIVWEAKEQAAQIAEAAERDAAQILRQAREEGYAQGLEKAAEEAKLFRKQETERLEGLLSKIEQARNSVIDELEQDIVSLILQIVKKVINIEMEKDDKIFEDMMQTALARLRKEGKIVIRMSPEEYRNFSSPNAQFVINNERIQAAIVEEPLFGKGDLIVESEGETINAGVDSQLRYIELAFRGQGNIA